MAKKLAYLCSHVRTELCLSPPCLEMFRRISGGASMHQRMCFRWDSAPSPVIRRCWFVHPNTAELHQDYMIVPYLVSSVIVPYTVKDQPAFPGKQARAICPTMTETVSEPIPKPEQSSPRHQSAIVCFVSCTCGRHRIWGDVQPL